jgi:CRISPR/Cas system-associated protein Cas10 (large subunit of type III CRISPR-Cas system)
MEYYLRVEAVNLDHFISDTMDISTIRGGGLLLLNAIEEKIKKRFEQQFEAISTGASSGLFSFKIADMEKAQVLRQQVVDFLNRDKRLKHATFVVDILPVGKTFNEDKEKVLALNRWQQMQSPTVVYPSLEGRKLIRPKRPICDIDNIRPLAKKISKKERVSESVFQRRQYGRWLKQYFYQQHTGIKKLPRFVNDLSELSYDKSRGHLHHKMAVIYLDGNGFGKIQQEICEGDENGEFLLDFDKKVKKYRRDFLRRFLTKTISQPEWTFIDPADKKNPEKHRLETLLWGGDEMTFVVPAWLGWWTLDYFFRESKEWNFEKDYPLTHGAGLVFCHHNAPIHRITKLAKDLAELAKAKSRKKSYVAYQVLESFDYVSEDLEEFRENGLARVKALTKRAFPALFVL